MCKLTGFLCASESDQHTGIAKCGDFPVFENEQYVKDDKLDKGYEINFFILLAVLDEMRDIDKILSEQDGHEDVSTEDHVVFDCIAAGYCSVWGV
jgi:hypothetical protein